VNAKKTRNPTWKRDELLLALELYLDRGQLDTGDEDVVALSLLLNKLPLHTDRPDAEKFRNPNGVVLKLANFRHLDPSDPAKGMSSGGSGDSQVWEDYSTDIPALKKITATIRQAAKGDAPIPVQREEDEEGVSEGAVAYRLHRQRERNASKTKEKKRKVLADQKCLKCEVCGFDFLEVYGELGDGFIECHHLTPISEPNRAKTKLSDLALVCANCHRMLHRGRPWHTVDGLKEKLRVVKHL
jgi:5-methylcytosine-specific restriction protein A